MEFNGNDNLKDIKTFVKIALNTGLLIKVTTGYNWVHVTHSL